MKFLYVISFIIKAYQDTHTENIAELAQAMTSELINQAARDAGLYVKEKQEPILTRKQYFYFDVNGTWQICYLPLV